MKAWMLSIADTVRPWLGLGSGERQTKPRKTRGVAINTRAQRAWTADPTRCEGLEGRKLLATSGVTAFAAAAGQVSTADQTSQVSIPIAAGQLTAGQMPTVVVGFSVQAADGATINPRIVRVSGPVGQISPLTIPNRGNTAADIAARQSHLFTRVIPQIAQAETLTVDIASQNRQTGDYIVEAFLAGDANGDGSVDSSDLAAVQAAYGTRTGQANFNAAADFNGDGRVGCIDRLLTTINLGARVATTPAVAATATTTPTPTPTAVPIPAATPAYPSVDLTQPTVAVSTPTPVAIPIATATATPTATTATPVYATSYVPVTLTQGSTLPVAATTTTATPLVVVPVANTSGSLTYPTTLAPTTTPAATPVYYIAQPAAATTSTTAAPVYIYGQPVVGGVPGTATMTPSATLFSNVTPTAATTTPVPVYIYNNG